MGLNENRSTCKAVRIHYRLLWLWLWLWRHAARSKLAAAAAGCDAHSSLFSVFVSSTNMLASAQILALKTTTTTASRCLAKQKKMSQGQHLVLPHKHRLACVK